MEMQAQAQMMLAETEAMGGPQDGIAAKSLYVGNLHPFVNETMLNEIFSTLGPVLEVKVIKDKVTSLSAGYGFVKFVDPRCADLALQQINGRVLYGQEVRVNWAFQKEAREDTTTHHHIFVGDLCAEVNDRCLYDIFTIHGCSDARVMWDHVTGRSKGYGFVSFSTKEKAEHAIEMMNGEHLGQRRIRCGWAQHKDSSVASDTMTVDRADPTNANVYVGNIPPEMSDADVKRHFNQWGTVLEVKTYRKGAYGFIQFQKHDEAVHAIVQGNGVLINGKTLKCSWGRHQARTSNNIHHPLMMGMPGGMGQGLIAPGISNMLMPNHLTNQNYQLSQRAMQQQLMASHQANQGGMGGNGLAGNMHPNLQGNNQLLNHLGMNQDPAYLNFFYQ